MSKHLHAFKEYKWLVYVCLLLTSCQTENEGGDKATLEVVKIIQFPLDAKANWVSPSISYYEDRSGRFLFYLDSQNRRLLLYDFDGKTLEKIIIFAEHGPDGVGPILRSVKVVNFDSLYLGGHPVQFFLADTSGRILERYSTVKEGNQFESPWLLLGNASPFIELGQKMVTTFNPITPNPTLETYKKPVLFSFDRNTKVWDLLPVTYPEVYTNPLGYWPLYHLKPACTSNGSQLVISFPASPALHIVHGGELVQTKVAESKWLPRPEAHSAQPATVAEINELEVSIGYYLAIIYDPYQKVYYRFVRHALEDTEDFVADQRQNIQNMPFSIIVLDEDFEWLGEVMMPPRTYVPFSFFVSPEGLCISNNRIDNPEAEEDALTFTVLRVKYL